MAEQAMQAHGRAPGMTAERERERELLAEAQVASIASPLGLGFAAFALPFFIWGAIFADFFDRATAAYFLIPIALVYGGATQVAAAMWAFRKHDGLLATVFGSYGAFWLTYGTFLWMERAEFLTFGGSTNELLGLFFVSWAVFAVYAWLAAMARGREMNYPMAGALLGAAATFVLAAIAYYADANVWYQIAGWVAMVTAVLGWYTSAAGTINHAVARMVLPTHAAPIGTEIERLERHPEHLI